MSDRRQDAACVLFLAACAALLLLPRALETGLHLDDHGFHLSLAHASWDEVWQRFLRYVPGRNLFILFYAALYRLLGDDPARLHAAGVTLDGLNAVLLFALIRQMGGSARLALPVAALFLVWPNHAETHFWTSAVAMNLLSTTFLLGAFLAAGWAPLGPRGRPVAALLLFALALFDYDQAFFMWVPLVFYAWRIAPAAPPSGLRSFAAACLTMNGIHAALRVLVPFSDAGRPVFNPWTFPRSAAKIVLENLAPLRPLPRWDELGSAVGGPAATAALVLVLGAGLWVSSRRDEQPLPAGAWRWAALGLIWTACGYLPNLFWHISPRHNYLPSAGLLLASAVIWRLRWSTRSWVLASAVAFAISAAALCAAASRWSAATSVLAEYLDQAAALVPAGSRGVYLLGAPESIRDAPAFHHPQEHLSLLREAGAASTAVGDMELAPTRLGAFHLNREELFGRTFQWEPLERHTILSWRDGRVDRVCRLRLDLPGGGGHLVELPPTPGCVELPLKVEGWLTTSSVRTSSQAASATGSLLLGAEAESVGGVLTLRLRWRAGREPLDLATLPLLRDEHGRELFRAAYPSGSARRRLWPMRNDLHPPFSWKGGEEVLETYLYRHTAPIPSRWKLELTLFRRDGDDVAPWKPVETQTFDGASR